MIIRMLRGLSPAVLLLAYFLVPTTTHAAASCAATPASLKGWYGLLVSGQTTAATPAAKIQSGAVLFDGVSTLRGSNIYGSGGSPSSLTGTYSVNSDCTITILATIGSTSSTYTVAIKATGEAVGIETDATAVSTISLIPQYATYTTGLNFTSSSLNGTFAASCGGFLGAYSDVNLVTFTNGTLSGTDPYNNYGSFAVANNPYTGTYKINSDGTIAGSVSVSGTSFNFYGVITNSNKNVEYFYTNVSNGVATDAFAACVGKTAPASIATLASQTITFNAIPAQKAGTTLALTATASSGLPVTYTSSTPQVCTVSGTATSLIAAGSCSIVASQSGNASYSAAPSVTQQFTVSAATVGTFTVSSFPSTVTVFPPVCIFFFCTGGIPAVDSLQVFPSGGFTGTVSFSVTGLPAGVTASFSPATVTKSGSTRMTLTAAVGTPSFKITTLTVTGTSGSTAASTKITLNY